MAQSHVDWLNRPDRDHWHLALSWRGFRDLPGLVEAIQAHVGVQQPPVGRFRIRLQLSRCLTLLESLFELPQVYVVFAQDVLE